jgi:hypothetical protein
MISLNSFGCPLFSRQSHLCIGADADVAAQKLEEKAVHHSCGVWPMASYINHCCNSNARRAFIGDLMFIREAKELAPNTEITFWYHMPFDESYEDRQKRLQYWGFKCDCSMCEDDQAATQGALAKRKRMKAALKKYFQSGSGASLSKIESILAAMTDEYRRPAIEVPRLRLWDLQIAVAQLHMDQKREDQAIDWALRALSSLGYVVEGGHLPHNPGKPLVVKHWGLMMDHLVGCWKLLSVAYRMVAPDLQAQAEYYARITYRVLVGEDETFEETHER